MKKIVLIVPYFGKFPNYFPLFLRTCSNNPTINWMIFTDIEGDYVYPENVQHIQMSFTELRERIQSKFEFPISLNAPYKLCDYKPAYGYIFEEYLKGYDFWGYCDIDLLFGDLQKFLPDEMLNDYDKIGFMGHLSLYRNNEEMRTAFQKEIDGAARYRQVFSTDGICVFDEWNYPGFHHILLRHGFRVNYWEAYFDVYPYDDQLKRVIQRIDSTKPETRKQTILPDSMAAVIEDGHAYCVKMLHGEAVKEEVAYVHFQKRTMKITIPSDAENILCVPDQFLSLDSPEARKQLETALRRKIVNRKRLKKQYADSRYWLIEKTGPIRHKLRKLRKRI